MPKQNQTAKAPTNNKSQPKPATTEPAAGSSALAELLPGPLGVTDTPSIAGQAARLGNARLQTIQRQQLANHIGKLQGNGHLQQVVNSLKQAQQSPAPTAPQAAAPTVTIHTLAHTTVARRHNAYAATGDEEMRYGEPGEALWGTPGALTFGSAPPPPVIDRGAPASIQRDEAAQASGPSEADKAAAKAKAAAAEQIAMQARAQGKSEVDKSQASKENEKAAGQSAIQKGASEKGAIAPPKEPKSLPLNGGAPKVESAGVVDLNSAKPALDQGSNGVGKAPASAQEDPAFQAVTGNVKGVAAKEKAHDPATAKAKAAQDAATSPAAELSGKAHSNQVGEMDAAETPGFDAAAFKAKLMQRIAELAPKNADDADKFKDNNKLGGVQGEMQGEVAQQRGKSQAPLDAATNKTPDTGNVEPKPVTPLQPNEAGPAPADVNATAAAPKAKMAGEVEQPLQNDAKQVDQQMAEANVTDEQLAQSNEPEFQSAASAKQDAQTHAQTAPVAYRQQEQSLVAKAEGDAVAIAQQKTAEMHGEKANALAQVDSKQGKGKSEDEKQRAEVGAHIQSIYTETKTNVETILNSLDGEVDKLFREGTEAAKKAFEDYVDAKMEAFKEDRYGGWLGWARWLDDKFTGMPPEVNAFYSEGRQLFIDKMDAVIDNVVALIGRKLSEAKAEIANGKKRIADYVNTLPENLQAVGQEAAQNIQSSFEELEQSVDAKQGELIDSLAQKYQENLKAVDARIDEMKAANRGLIDKAMDAIGGVIKTILELKDMLMNVLARAAAAIGKIIKHPIQFLGNLIDGVKLGLSNFVSNIGTHLQQGLIGWLTGAIGGAGITMPKSFDLQGIFQLVMQILGLTFEQIMGKVNQLLGFDVMAFFEPAKQIIAIYQEEGLMGLAKHGLTRLIGEEGVQALMNVVQIFQALVSGDWGKVWEIVSGYLESLKEMVFGKIEEFITERVIKAGITWVVSLFNPAGAFIKACKAIYDIIMFFVERGKQIMALVNAVIDSVAALADGNIGAAAGAIENALARGIPVAIGFLSSLLGLGNVSEKVQEIIQSVRSLIDRALDAVFNSKPVQLVSKFIKKAIEKIKGVVKAGVGWVKGKLGGKKDKEGDGATTPEQTAGVQAIATEEQKHVKEGAMPHKEAEKTAADVLQQHPVFSSLTVIDGGDSWDYQYVFRAVGKKNSSVKKAGGEPLEAAALTSAIKGYRPGWSDTTKEELSVIYPEHHEMDDEGNVMDSLKSDDTISRKGNIYEKYVNNRRHITALADIKSYIVSRLVGARFDQAAITLQNEGVTATSLTFDGIVEAMKAYIAVKFNEIRNLHVGDAEENQELGRQMGAAKRDKKKALKAGDTEGSRKADERYRQAAHDPEPIDYSDDPFAKMRG